MTDKLIFHGTAIEPGSVICFGLQGAFEARDSKKSSGDPAGKYPKVAANTEEYIRINRWLLSRQ